MSSARPGTPNDWEKTKQKQIQHQVNTSICFMFKVMFNDNVGIRAQARLAMTFLSTSTAIFCGTGGGCALGLAGGGIAQVDFSIGPTFAF